jgi:hypothetical protein
VESHGVFGLAVVQQELLRGFDFLVAVIGLFGVGEILATINALYTVYSNLILFDTQGIVVAVSQPSQAHLVGQKLEAEWAARTLALRTGQHYAVSAFEPTPLYGEAATLIYTAAVQSPVGGRALGAALAAADARLRRGEVLHAEEVALWCSEFQRLEVELTAWLDDNYQV